MEKHKTKIVYVDPFTGLLFENFVNIHENYRRDELVDLAADFIEVIENHFSGISIDYTAEDYADWYITKGD
tara:strand:+ start:43 stop:255 length:213 start_codon:yes stop_codon:yes gene_type:complete